MRVAAFMSGSGTNIIRLLEREKHLRSRHGSSPYEVVFIFSDRSDGGCHGERIAHETGIPYFSYDIRAFHRLRGLPRRVSVPEGLIARREFDRVAGYMSYTTLNRCVNIHPADLSILAQNGERRYVGDNAVFDAIDAGETTLRSSTLWTDQGVDTGPLLMVSDPLQVELSDSLDSSVRDKEKLIQAAGAHQDRLKEVGDWKIFPQTIEMIAGGRFALDESDNVYVDGDPVPQGYRE